MGLLGSIFGKKNAPSAGQPPAAAPEPEKKLEYEEICRIQDPARRISLMIELAQEGDTRALCAMGEDYLFGQNGVQKDTEKGKQYLYAAGQKGVTNAVVILAQFCIKQAFNQIKEDQVSTYGQQKCIENFWEHYSEGVEHLAWAIAKGNPVAMDTATGTIALGWNEGEWGKTLTREIVHAMQPHLAELKEADTPESNYTLGVLLIRGIGVSQDIPAARAHLERSAAQGNDDARKELENLLLIEDDEDEEN